MGKAKKPVTRGIKNAKLPKEALENAGSLGQAFGFEANGFGFPGNQSAPFSAQLSKTDTIFYNLRYYFISNFRQVLSQAYCELGLIQTVVDVPVDDGLRGGIEIHSKQLDEDQIKKLQVSLDRDDDLNVAGQAAKWNRLFGGAGILIMTDQDPSSPLDLNLITADSPLEFRAVDMWELFWDKQNTEGYDPEIQTQEFEFYNYYAIKLHKSRVMRLKGFTAPSFLRPRLRGWGMSVVEVLVRSINQYLKATDLGFEVLDEFKLDVYKIKNLVNTLLSPQGMQKVKERVAMANWQKNYQNAIVMDSEDDFDHKQLSFAGLAEAMAGIRLQVASDLRMPITKLFGTSVSSGIGNTDQNDMENYNSMVEAQVRNKLKYDLLRMCEIKCQKLFGFVPDDMEIMFKPLRVLSAEQEENVKTQKFARLLQAATSAKITDFEFREGVNKGNLLEIQLDNSGDVLNPDDPDVAQIVDDKGRESAKDKEGSTDIDDPGANRTDTRKPRAWDTTTKEVQGNPNKKRFNPDDQPKERTVTNESAAFEKASYEADGGDAWVDPRRKYFFDNPVGVDQGMWTEAKEVSRQVFGTERWQFTLWKYKKLGGRFK